MPSLLTISIYDVHHIIGRFVRLYKQVQVVSDCLVFTCSIICCQCWAMLPDNPEVNARRSSHEGFMFLPQHVLDARQAGGDPLKPNILTDFSPQKEDSEEIQKKCIEFWRKENVCSLSLQETSAEFNKSLENTIHCEQAGVFPDQNSPKTAHGDELPAVHTKSKITNNNSLILKSPTTSPRAVIVQEKL